MDNEEKFLSKRVGNNQFERVKLSLLSQWFSLRPFVLSAPGLFLLVSVGVIFALKVITTHMLPPGTQHVLGFIPVNSRLACWVELVVIQLLVPRASFLGE